VPKKADAIVIGSGALGGSVAYQLRRAGYRTALLDRHAIPRQTSSRAAEPQLTHSISTPQPLLDNAGTYPDIGPASPSGPSGVKPDKTRGGFSHLQLTTSMVGKRSPLWWQ
jgi:choline dehydrogenase-like flavoprotein